MRDRHWSLWKTAAQPNVSILERKGQVLSLPGRSYRQNADQGLASSVMVSDTQVGTLGLKLHAQRWRALAIGGEGEPTVTVKLLGLSVPPSTDAQPPSRSHIVCARRSLVESNSVNHCICCEANPQADVCCSPLLCAVPRDFSLEKFIHPFQRLARNRNPCLCSFHVCRVALDIFVDD